MVKVIMLRRLLVFLLIPFLTASPALGGPGLALPELGGGGIRILAGSTEDEIGRTILNELRRSNLVLDDPELTEYLQHLGARLVATAHNGRTRFTFFIVKDDSINAFALPGGYIGINSGLFLRTTSESELAGVLAHEVAHVTQRHVSRRFQASAGSGLKALGLLLGTIALAASGAEPDDLGGAIMLGQGMLIQEQINFTRTQEYEADRVGVELLAKSGFDPAGMVSFFETMQRIQRLQNSRMPEFLSTHPLSLSRVSEAAQRVQAMENTEYHESRSYPLMKARLAILTDQDPISLRAQQKKETAAIALQYAQALQELQRGEAQAAVEGFRRLLAKDESVTHFHIGLGNALLDTGKHQESISVFEQASQLFPSNAPVALAHARALRHSGKPEMALQRLRELAARQETGPEILRLMAQTAGEAGAMADSHYYMGEYYLSTGDLGSAREQLQLALNRAESGSRQRLQYTARLDEINRALQELRRTGPRRQPAEQRR